MTTPDELADALYESRYGQDGYDSSVVVSAVELRTLARAAAKAAWEEGYADGVDEALGDPDRPMARPENPYSTESYE